MFGKILGAAVRIVNAPIKACEKVVAYSLGETDLPEELKIASKPLDALAEEFEEIDK